jgi:hypothetical protein
MDRRYCDDYAEETLVEESEKEAKEVDKTVAKESAGAGNVVLHPRLRQILDQINGDVEAGKAFREIKKRGCDEAELLTVLFRFCGGSEEEIRGGLDAAVAFKAEVERLAERLKQDADAVKKIMVELPRFGLNLTVREYDNLAPGLEDFADTLTRYGRSLTQSLGNVRLGSKKKGKGRVTLTAGRTHHLVELADLVIGNTAKAASADEKPRAAAEAPDREEAKQPKLKQPGAQGKKYLRIEKLVKGARKPTLADFKLIAPLVAVVLEDYRLNKYIADDLRNRFNSYIKPERSPKR